MTEVVIPRQERGAVRPKIIRVVLVVFLATVMVFWPVAVFYSRIQFDIASFVTEWLKIAFTSVILILIVEVGLERNRAASRQSMFAVTFATEIVEPLTLALDIIGSVSPEAGRPSAGDTAFIMAKTERSLRRAKNALSALPPSVTGPALTIALTHLRAEFDSYDWQSALSELGEVVEWHPAQLAELERLKKHARTLFDAVTSKNLQTE